MKKTIISECNVIKGDEKKFQYPLMLTDKNDTVIVYIGVSSDKISKENKKMILKKLQSALDNLITEAKEQSS